MRIKANGGTEIHWDPTDWDRQSKMSQQNRLFSSNRDWRQRVSETRHGIGCSITKNSDGSSYRVCCSCFNIDEYDTDNIWTVSGIFFMKWFSFSARRSYYGRS